MKSNLEIRQETERENDLANIQPLSNAKLNETLQKIKTLKKKELIHLITSCPTIIESFRRNRIHQKHIDKKWPDSIACFDCYMIARKLNLECSLEDLGEQQEKG